MRFAAWLYELQVPLERPAIAAGLALVGPRSGERLLDVGAGTGALLRALEQRAPEVSAVGVDRSPVLLDAARELLPRARLVRGDAHALPFPSGSFDVVTLAFLLHVLTPADRAQALREVRRVLVPGGRILTITPYARRPLTRGLLERLPRTSWLRPLDPTEDLRAAGLTPLRGWFVPRGWPSLCVLAGEVPPG